MGAPRMGFGQPNFGAIQEGEAATLQDLLLRLLPSIHDDRQCSLRLRHPPQVLGVLHGVAVQGPQLGPQVDRRLEGNRKREQEEFERGMDL